MRLKTDLTKIISRVTFHANREVTRLDGARGKKQVWRPLFESELFQKQIYCIEESACDIVGAFRRPPQHFGAQQ